MKIVAMSLIASLLAMLAGCAVYTPSGAVVIDPQPAPVQRSGGGFCPPGQAKKGNC